MPDKFKQKYTIKSARLEGYDYSKNGMYFVTICAKDREHYFGEVKNGKMILNDIGKIVQEELSQTPIIRQNVILDEQIIMPNHLHAILEILCKIKSSVETPRATVETPRRGVSTTAMVAVDDKLKRGGYNPQWKPNSLGSIINQIKSVCTKKIWKSEYPNFAWQSRFYDHIIRNDESLNRIREYIINNPAMWERDRNNVENIWM
ncbi:MAG: transposase [Patescibacteria group bacterium]|jgi:REP element-mobilizing transposase RayT